MDDFATRTREIEIPGRQSVEVVEMAGPEMTAGIVPAVGGELSSLRVIWQGSELETIYRAFDYSPLSSWTGRAPLLWPQPGRCRLPGETTRRDENDREIGTWSVDGKRLGIPGHGFVRDQEWTLEGHGVDDDGAWAEVAITDNEISRPYFPFAFRLTCRYILDARSLRLRYTIRNNDAEGTFPCGFGNHISFKMPLTDAGEYDDCIIYSPTDRQMEVAPDAFLTGGIIAKDMARGRKMSDPTMRDTMIGGYTAENSVVEVWDPASFGFRVSQRAVGGPDPEELGDVFRFVFWANPELRYFCPEPWLGEPNLMNTRQQCVILGPGESFTWEIAFTPILTSADLSFDPAGAE